MVTRRLRVICVSSFSSQAVRRVLATCIILDNINWTFTKHVIFSFYCRWWISLGFAIVEAVIVACYSLQYSIYAASYRYFNNVNMKATISDAKKLL